MCHDKLLGALWNKMIRKECYDKYNIGFVKDLNYCEDFLICVKLLRNNDVSLSYVSKSLYHYDQCVNNNSYTKIHRKNTQL